MTNIENVKDIEEKLDSISRETVSNIRFWLLKRGIILRKNYLSKEKLLKLVHKELIREKLPKPFEIADLIILHVGLVADPKTVCMFGATCRRMYNILSSNIIWKEKCKELTNFSKKDLNKKRDMGYWKKWFINNYPITIPLQAPVLEKWTFGEMTRNVYIPTIGTLIRQTEQINTPEGIIITFNSFYVCTKINLFTKGKNKGLTKSIHLASNSSYDVESIEDFEFHKTFTYTLSTERYVDFSYRGRLKQKFDIISNTNIYP